MPVGLEAMPEFEQWKLLLLLRKAATGGTFRASRALDVSGARPSDLPALAECGWIEGLRDRHSIDLTDQDNWAQGLASVDLRLTTDGLRWTRESPLNMILFAIHARSGRLGASLYEVAQDTAAHVPWFARLGSGRYITVHDIGGEIIDPERLGPVPGHVLQQTVRLTARGAELVNI